MAKYQGLFRHNRNGQEVIDDLRKITRKKLSSGLTPKDALDSALTVVANKEPKILESTITNHHFRQHGFTRDSFIQSIIREVENQ